MSTICSGVVPTESSSPTDALCQSSSQFIDVHEPSNYATFRYRLVSAGQGSSAVKPTTAGTAVRSEPAVGLSMPVLLSKRALTENWHRILNYEGGVKHPLGGKVDPRPPPDERSESKRESGSGGEQKGPKASAEYWSELRVLQELSHVVRLVLCFV